MIEVLAVFGAFVATWTQIYMVSKTTNENKGKLDMIIKFMEV